MTYSRDGRTLKEFRAVCPVTKFMASRVFPRLRNIALADEFVFPGFQQGLGFAARVDDQVKTRQNRASLMG